MFDRLTGRHVALKRVLIDPYDLLGGTTAHHEASLALAQEFRVLAGMRHPNIVSVLDYGFDTGGYPYYSMELFQEAAPFTVAGARADDDTKTRLSIELLQALEYLHRRGVIHRDLKPNNVMVTVDGVVKVVDFGLALQNAPTDPNADDEDTAGTLAYMAPERLEGKVSTAASDLFAVGIMLCELWAGHHPFDTSRPMNLIAGIANDPPNLAGVPPWLAPIISRLLAKHPPDRYPRALDVIHAIATAADYALPLETDSMRESFLQASRFVGRERELGTLQAALDDTLNDMSSAWLIGGESGVGKSRLLDEIRTYALVKGCMVWRGQAVSDGGLPLQLWRDVVRRLVFSVELSDYEAQVLQSMVPDIETLLGRDIPPPLNLSLAGLISKVSDLLVLKLKSLTQPIVLLLEDLQWAGDSLRPLKALLKSLDEIPKVMIIATFRDDEAPDLPQILRGCHYRKLDRLNAATTADLVRSMLGTTSHQEQLVEFLHSETEGNLFFMVETVRVLAEDAGSLQAIGQKTLPAGIMSGGMQAIVQRRLNQLPAAQHPYLKMAAVAGRVLDMDILQHLAPVAAWKSFITAAAEVSILDVVENVWRFSHDKLREGALADLSDDERRTYNRAVAEAIESIYAGNFDYDEILFEHWHAAGDVERELPYLIEVARIENRIRRNQPRALELFERGVMLAGEDNPRIAELYNVRCDIAFRMDDYDAATAFGRQALDYAERLDNIGAKSAALSKLGVVQDVAGDSDVSRDYFLQALDLCREQADPKCEAAVLNNLGINAKNRGDYQAALRYQEAGLAIRLEMNRHDSLLHSYHNLHELLVQMGKIEQAMHYMRLALDIGQQNGDRVTLAAQHAKLARVMIIMGELVAAEAESKKALAHYEYLQARSNIAAIHSDLALIYRYQGRLDEAATLAYQSFGTYEQINEPRGIAQLGHSVAAIEGLRGNFEQAAAHMHIAKEQWGKYKDQLGWAKFYGTQTFLALLQDERKKAQIQLTLAQDHLEKVADKQYQAWLLTYEAILNLRRGKRRTLDLLTQGIRLSLEIESMVTLPSFVAMVARLMFDIGQHKIALPLVGMVDAFESTTADIRALVLDGLLDDIATHYDTATTKQIFAQSAELDIVQAAEMLLGEKIDGLAPLFE